MRGLSALPCLFNLYSEHIMRNAELDELQAKIKIGGRIINNLRYMDDTSLMAESEEELKSLLMRVKEESERASLKLNLKKKKNQTLRSWHLVPLLHGRGKVEVVTDFLFLGSNLKSLQMVTAAMKLAIASWQDNGDKSGQCVEKHRHDSADKGLYSQAMVFSVVMYGCEILTVKKVE